MTGPGVICSSEHAFYNSLCTFNRTEEIVMPAERSGKIKENYEWKVRHSIYREMAFGYVHSE